MAISLLYTIQSTYFGFNIWMRSHTVVCVCLAYVTQCNVFEFIHAVTCGHFLFTAFVLRKIIIIIKAILIGCYKMQAGSHLDIAPGMTPAVNCFLKCEPFTRSICNTGTTWQCLCTLSLRMSVTRQLDSNFMGFEFSLHILSLPSLQSMAQLSPDFPSLSQDPDSGYLNLESWIVLPTTPETAFLPDAVSESKIQRHYTSATFCLSIHPSRHKWVDSLSWLLWDLRHQLWECRFWCMYWLHHTCINMNTHTCMQAGQLAYKLQLYLFGILFGGGGVWGEFSFPKIFLFESISLYP